MLQIQAEVPLERDMYEQMTCKSRKSLDDESWMYQPASIGWKYVEL
jgi:hypothetical protein